MSAEAIPVYRPVPGMRGFTATVSRAQGADSSIKIGSVSVGRDGSDYLIAIRNPDGIVLTAALSGYFFDRFADNLASLVEAENDAEWARRARATVALRPINAATADRFGFPVHRFFGPGYERDLARARWASCWVMRKATAASLPQIARHVGYNDHTAVKYALTRAEELRASDLPFRAATDALLAQFEGKVG